MLTGGGCDLPIRAGVIILSVSESGGLKFRSWCCALHHWCMAVQHLNSLT